MARARVRATRSNGSARTDRRHIPLYVGLLFKGNSSSPLTFETGPDQNSRSKSRVRMHAFAGATYIKRALNNGPRSAHHTRAPRVTRRDACARRVHTHTPCPHLHLRGAYDPSRRPSRRFVLGPPPRPPRARGPLPVPAEHRSLPASRETPRARRRVRANAASDARASSSRRAAASSGVSGEESPRADRNSATSSAEGSRSSDAAAGARGRVSFVTFRSVAPRATSAASTSSGGGRRVREHRRRQIREGGTLRGCLGASSALESFGRSSNAVANRSDVPPFGTCRTSEDRSRRVRTVSRVVPPRRGPPPRVVSRAKPNCSSTSTGAPTRSKRGTSARRAADATARIASPSTRERSCSFTS